MQREHKYSLCFDVSRPSFSVMASRSARPRLRAANIDLWVMTGLPSAVHNSFWRAFDGESWIEKFVTPNFGALKGDNGGVEDESDE